MTRVIARAPGWVYLGGLGALRVGEMWVEEREDHKDYPGYDEAPVQPYPPAHAFDGPEKQS